MCNNDDGVANDRSNAFRKKQKSITNIARNISVEYFDRSTNNSRALFGALFRADTLQIIAVGRRCQHVFQISTFLARNANICNENTGIVNISVYEFLNENVRKGFIVFTKIVVLFVYNR